MNFTGKPFAPDSIFINNIGKNLGDEDDGGGEFDHVSEIATKEIVTKWTILKSSI